MILTPEAQNEVDKKVLALEKEIADKKAELRDLRATLPVQQVPDYTFEHSGGGEMKLSELFGDKDELILVSNMGKSCRYCTLWADNYNGIVKPLNDRAAFAVVSPDAPEVQKEFAESRGWNFRLLSHQNNSWAKDFGFNGMEKDDEVAGNGNTYDYGFRIYNPRLGRFLSVDPLSSSYPFWTPYAFAGNTPIQAIDLDGLEILDYRPMYNLKVGTTEIGTTYSIEIQPGSTYTKITHNLKGNWNRGNGKIVGLFIRDESILASATTNTEQAYTGSLSDPLLNNRTTMMNEKFQKLHGGPKAFDSKAGEGYQQIMNRSNDVKSVTGILASGLEESMKLFYRYGPEGRDQAANADVDNQINAFVTAAKAVEKWDFSTVKGDADMFRKDITQYLVDGRLPDNKYGQRVKKLGDMLISRNPETLNTQSKLNVDN